MNTATSFIAITLYIVATALQLRRMRAASNSTVGPGPTALAIGALATTCHLFAAASAIHAAALDAVDCGLGSAVRYAQAETADRVRAHIPFDALPS